MNEYFLQFIWKHCLFDHGKLHTTDGVPVKVLSPGTVNHDAGPDFFNARLLIGDTTWAGNVELHLHASDWERHKHQADPAYNNVILHVVKYHDRATVNAKGQPVHTMVLPYNNTIEQNYADLLRSTEWVLCRKYFHRIDLLSMQIWYHGLAVERLQQKTAEIAERLNTNKNNWNEAFYQFLARNFGFKVNSVPFGMLAGSVPLNVLGRHKDNLLQIEALLFGAAGLLNEELTGDEYFMALKKEFSFLCGKYKLKPVEAHLWKFMRLRPVNFPTLRIAQFARLMQSSSALFSQIAELKQVGEIKKLFMVQASDYWDNHYRFNKSSPPGVKRLGDAALNNIIINTIVPFLFVFGSYYDRQEFMDRAVSFLEEIPPETNSIISGWKKMGTPVRSAFDTQALIQLKSKYCNTKNCLNCSVGVRIVSQV